VSDVSARWSRVRNLVIGRFERTSDLLLAEPTLAAVRENLPGARITLWMSSQPAPAAPLVAGDADLLVTPGWLERQPTDEPPASTLPALGEEAQRLRAGGFDAALLLTRFEERSGAAALVLRLAGVPAVAAHADEVPGTRISDPITPLSADAHQVNRDLHLVEALGFRVSRRRLSVTVSPSTAARTARLLSDLGLRSEAGYVAIEVANGGAAPSYQADRLADVGRRIAKALGVGLVLIGDETAGDYSEEIASSFGDDAVAVTGRTSPATLAAVLADARAYVGHAGWLMYLAEALGTPGVVFWGGDRQRSRLRPRSPGLLLLRREVDCASCDGADCSRERFCLDLPPADVANAVLLLIGGRGTRAAPIRMPSG
jgi:ADP-heptose:LPS heptosyltransferase